MRLLSLTSLIGFLAFNTTLHGQERIVYRSATIPSNVVISTTTASSPITQIIPAPETNCNCPPGHPPHHGHCTENPHCSYLVKPSPGAIRLKTRTPIKVTMPGPHDCDIMEITTPFYEKDIQADGTIDVPKSIKNTVEKYLFERRSYTLCGCTINICVPCAIECSEKIECKPTPTTVPLVIRVRTDLNGGNKVADVWANNIRGLPSQAVLGLKLTATEINNTFKTNVSF